MHPIHNLYKATKMTTPPSGGIKGMVKTKGATTSRRHLWLACAVFHGEEGRRPHQSITGRATGNPVLATMRGRGCICMARLLFGHLEAV
jgi:hypothetical protein